MRLKIVTSIFLVLVVILLGMSGAVFGPVPSKTASREVKRQYGVRTLGYLSVLLVTFTAAGVGSYLVFKNAREEYRAQSVENLKSLLDAASAPAKKSADDSEPS